MLLGIHSSQGESCTPGHCCIDAHTLAARLAHEGNLSSGRMEKPADGHAQTIGFGSDLEVRCFSLFFTTNSEGGGVKNLPALWEI